MTRKRKPSDFEELRNQAEARLTAGHAVRASSTPELARLIHELDVHRIELELQNEELRAARLETEIGLARYTAVFEFAPIGYATLNERGIVEDINHTGARLLQRNRALIQARSFANFVATRDLPLWEELIQTVLFADGSGSTDIELQRLDVPFAARISAAAIEQSDRTILVAFQDVSEQRQRERQVADAEQALREADQRKDEFLAVLSHELRNPLSAIRSSLFLLTRAEPDGDRARRAHAVIERQVTHLARLVDDLLDVTRIARGKIQLQRERVELVDLIYRTVEDHRSRFESAGIGLQIELAPGPCWVDADPARLVQTVTNVLGNAEKFTPRGGTVTLELHRAKSTVELRVRDTGSGIAPEVIKHLFEPFAQAPQTMERTRGGLGLGLAMVKGLVELHGGRVGIRSEGLGCGTELKIELPESEAPTPSARAPKVPISARRRVLIIEDNVDASDSLMDVLTLSGHDVRNAYDGQRGIETAKSFYPEIVICDIGLPHMNGYEVARAFRASVELRDVFLVALSGYAHPEDVQRATDAGFDRHMAKPPSLDKLERILAEAPKLYSAPSTASLSLNVVQS